ncbi:hypothetical protein Tco_1069823 [Tanacetum coccineum]|uniref:Uncharacterized protein n=1 Tax=Tanacetum coccineum TaxID=301880 RepID=A0ABQ5HL46_9ASTR
MSVYEIGEHSANMLESILEYKLNKAVADNGSDGGKPNESPNAITNKKHHSLLLQIDFVSFFAIRPYSNYLEKNLEKILPWKIPNSERSQSKKSYEICTRPDVAFAQNMTSQFQQNPSDLHWTIVKNILKYLRNTKDIFLVYVFVLNGGDVDWKSTKQSIFATSSTDDEYIVAFDASKEDVWIRKFISGLGVVPTIEEPINTYYNNTGAIANREISCSSLKVQVPISQQKSLSRETINIDVKIEKG